jgi:hypothetical protein
VHVPNPWTTLGGLMAGNSRGTYHRHPQYPAHTAWTDWSPSYANLTVGDGTVVARYTQIGKTIVADFTFTLGSTSAVGTGPTVSLPVNANTSNYTLGLNLVGTALMGGVTATPRTGMVRLATGQVMEPFAQTSSGTYTQIVGVTAAVPLTWATGDVLYMRAIYEVD